MEQLKELLVEAMAELRRIADALEDIVALAKQDMEDEDRE